MHPNPQNEGVSVTKCSIREASLFLDDLFFHPLREMAVTFWFPDYTVFMSRSVMYICAGCTLHKDIWLRRGHCLLISTKELCDGQATACRTVPAQALYEIAVHRLFVTTRL